MKTLDLNPPSSDSRCLACAGAGTLDPGNLGPTQRNPIPAPTAVEAENATI